eukprot:8578595-Alexandrium_andersonii.AAC.1
MCIRDSLTAPPGGGDRDGALDLRSAPGAPLEEEGVLLAVVCLDVEREARAVSYTHLTLPTICSV